MNQEGSFWNPKRIVLNRERIVWNCKRYVFELLIKLR